jgi:hypothetical protein
MNKVVKDCEESILSRTRRVIFNDNLHYRALSLNVRISLYGLRPENSTS